MKMTQHAKTILLINAIAIGMTVSAQAKAQTIMVEEGYTYPADHEDMVIIEEGGIYSDYAAYPDDFVVIQEGSTRPRNRRSVVVIEQGEIEPEPLFFFYD